LSEPESRASPSERRARLLGLVAAEPSPSRLEVQKRALAWSALGLLVPLGGFALLGGVRQGPRPSALLLATALGTASIALVALGLALGRAGRTLGPTRARLLAVALLPPLLLTLWKVGVSSTFAGMTELWPARPGLRCFGLSLLFGIVPLSAFLVARRASDPVHPRSFGAALGAAAGLWAATLVDLWCPVAYPLHVVLGHALPALLLAGLGAWAGAYALTPSRKSGSSSANNAAGKNRAPAQSNVSR
jgi:hypothetical protein